MIARRILPLICLVAASLGASSARANNTFFLPGDSFFFFRLSQADMTRLHPQKTFEWGYSLPHESVYLCGYAGYNKIRLTMPTEQRRALGRAIKELTEFAKPDQDGKRRVGIFVYNPDFSIQKQRLCVQYNERWAEETANFGHLSDHVRMEDFVGTTKALMEGWRDASKVQPLKAELKPVPAKFRGAFNQPVTPAEFQLILVADRNFEAYFERKNGARIIQLQGKQLSRFTGDKGKWLPVQSFSSKQN